MTSLRNRYADLLAEPHDHDLEALVAELDRVGRISTATTLSTRRNTAIAGLLHERALAQRQASTSVTGRLRGAFLGRRSPRVLARRWLVAGGAVCSLVLASVSLGHTLLAPTPASAYDVLHWAPQVTTVLPGQVVHLTMEVHNSGNGLPPVELRDEWALIGPDDGSQSRGSYTLLKDQVTMTLPDGSLVGREWANQLAGIEGSYDARRRHVDLYTAAPSPAARCAAVHCTSGMGHIESFYAVPAPYNEVLLQWNAAPGVVEGGVQKLADASVRGVPTYVLRSGGGAYPTTTTIWIAKDTSLVTQYQEVEQDAGRVTRQTTTVLTFHVVPVAQVPASVFNPPIPAGATVTSHHP